MEKIIVNRETRTVIYDTEKKIYKKYIRPKICKRIKCFLRLRRYPGENYKYISDILETAGIRVVEVLSYSKYSVITKEIVGKSLLEELITSDKEKGKELIKKYIELASKIINLGIYFGDFNFGNFIVSNGEIYAIDLEDYRKDFFSAYRRKSVIKRLKRQLIRRTEILGKMSEFFNGNDVFNEIEKRLK